METNNLLAPLFFVLIGLMGGAILKFGLKKMPLPYTVGLFAFGLLIGTFDRIGWLESIPILKSSIDFAGNANPDMILYIFLPILIFDLSGRLVKQEHLQGNERYSLENGIYTVVMEDSISGKQSVYKASVY